LVIKDKIKNIKATLEGIEWGVEIDGKIYEFKAPILGRFNAINITLAIFQAMEFIEDIKYLQEKVQKLKPIPHRLQKMEVGGKIIIDDSYNGNLEGMLESYDLVKEYKGRKIVITPGIVEATNDQNIKLAKKIDEVFDLAIITGYVNRDTLDKNINIAKIIVSNKKDLKSILSANTKIGDLIIFSNDTPEYL